MATTTPRRLPKAKIMVAVVLGLMITGGAFAGWLGPAPAHTPSDVKATRVAAAFAQATPTPLTPAKEYVYAGGRLVATEEPTPTSTPVPTPTPVSACTPPTGVIISEFRLRGPDGQDDEFVELFNTSISLAVTVCTADGSAGWAIASSDGAVRYVVPYGTVIPARGHFLAAGGAYSLANYGGAGNGAGDGNYSLGVPDGTGVALFNTAIPQNFSTSTRLDAAGFAADANAGAALYREGAGLAAVVTDNAEHSFVRNLVTGAPKDTGDNAADFQLVSTTAATFDAAVSILGAPGPQNLASPVNHNNQLATSLIDPTAASSSAPNRVRDTAAVGTNATFGTLTIRRKYTNNTGLPVTRLRFRAVDVTTLNAPGYTPQNGQADMRLLTSGDLVVNINPANCGGTTPCVVVVRGTTLEDPPAQSSGGGQNSTARAGTISLATPLAAGNSISVQFVLGVVKTGTFRFNINVEAVTQ